MLRNVVEKIFRELRRRFQIFLQPSAFTFLTQVKLVHAATALHNYLLQAKRVYAFNVASEVEDDGERSEEETETVEDEKNKAMI
jgi:hypothetical protein